MGTTQESYGMRRRDVLAVGLSSASWALPGGLCAFAQGSYPEQPIRLIVPRSAGGVVDVVARLWADRMRGELGTIVVEDQGGGGGTIAAASVARARPDGYTLLAGTSSELVISPVIMTAPTYDPARDLAPITITAVSVSALMVHASLPVHTLAELIAYAKANPGKLSYGSAGVGSSAHLCAELFKKIAGLPDIVHVPYKGANPGLVDFYAGQLPMFAASISPQVLDMHRQGKIRILVAGTNRRLVAAPDIPISTDVGFPDLITLMFMGVFAPAGTPGALIVQIAGASRRVMLDKAFQNRLVQAGFEPVVDSGPEQTAQFVQQELVRWTPLLKTLNLKM
jgi:tripartite-type tricarboxylate transporter receptor subunit TctC